MENQRETKTLKTKGGHEIVMYTYVTGREMRAIQNIFLENVKMSLKGKNAEMSEIPAELSSKAEDKTIEILVLSIDGKKENIVDLIVDLPMSDYDEVIAELNKMTDRKKEESDTSTR